MSGTEAAATEAEDSRIHELDAVRGFALCGITLVNAWQLTVAKTAFPTKVPVDTVTAEVFQGRFFPIFSFLFGLGFVLFLRSASRRSPRPRLVLLRRLLVLAALGGLHRGLYPNEVLLPYAVFGAVVLLPASFLPRAAVLVGALVALGWASVAGGGSWLVPGLFLLGMAMMEYRPGRRWAPAAFAVSAAVSVALVALRGPLDAALAGSPFDRALYPLTALAGAAAYGTGMLMLLRRSRTLCRLLAPVGRMALTNYVAATPVFLAAIPVLSSDSQRISVFVLAGALIVFFAAFSRWWLTRFRYGPLEWVWRCLTWWRRIPNRR
ncbi:Uncharacterized membrane protein YeiB [Sinosporangium album]|uniref:Uncharacterized membrane protein YeiB n=1 Tax=Sinosporangium album TaxID=504805 RepID=A0A1G7RAJ2_9ACTN|nr:DUF418 domain-containing protein [Sinosporangium album]SDG07743.1 Uncharacterized membrane protein YeiB [Sinosporangium album]